MTHRLLPRLAIVVALAVGGGGTSVLASGGRQVDIPERAHGAQKVVVATAANVSPTWRTNEHGDRLIVSQVLLQVHETLKGEHQDAVMLDLEGGTLDGYTLKVSDLPQLAAGERAVFFLDQGASGYVPHLKGLGILKLGDDDRVQGSNLQLSDIRQMTRDAK